MSSGSILTHLCRPVRSTFAVRETASLGIMGAPLRVDSALRALSTLRGLRGGVKSTHSVVHSERKYKSMHQGCDSRVGKAVNFYSALNTSAIGSRTWWSNPFSDGSCGILSRLRWCDLIHVSNVTVQTTCFPDYYIGSSNRIQPAPDWKLFPRYWRVETLSLR